jgi:hypothetical protein
MKTFKHKKNFKLIEEIKVVQVNGNWRY